MLQEVARREAQPHGRNALFRDATFDQQLPGGKWKAGLNYTPIVPAQPTSVGPDKIEVVEVFWYGCPHCFDLEPFIQSWLQLIHGELESCACR